MTTKQVSEILETEHVRKSKGQFKYWISYFYRHGRTPESMAEYVKTKLPNAVITGTGDHWHAFVGGAESGSAKDSFMWVTFTT
jgi:hypothetical protein